MPLRRRLFFVVVLAFATQAPAQQKRGLAVEEKAPLRVYDVHDLIIDIPDFVDVPELGIVEENAAPQPAAKAAPEAAPEPNGRPRAELLAELLRVLPLKVTPKEHEGQLMVRATPEEHAAVARALGTLRERYQTQATIECRLVRVDEAALETVGKQDAGLARKLRLASFRGGDRAGTLLSPEEAARLTMNPVTCPRLTVFSGQRAYVLVANQRAFVAEVVPKKAPDAEPEVKIKTTNTGVILAAQATAAPGTHAVALNARVQYATLLAMRDAAAPGSKPEDDLRVQVPDYVKEVVGINAVVPHGTYVLFGVTESSRPNAPEADAKAGADGGTLFAVVRVSVIRHEPVN